MDLLNMLSGLLTSSSSVDALSSKAGTEGSQAKDIISTALPMLLGAMTNNASSQEGAESLSGALAQHTNKESMAEQIANADEQDGNKIISHILGGNREDTVKEISAKTGADADKISSVLSNMAPALMSGISAAASVSKEKKAEEPDAEETKQQGLDLSGILGMFGGAGADNNEAGGLGGLLGGLFGGSGKDKEDGGSDGGNSLLGLLGSFMK